MFQKEIKTNVGLYLNSQGLFLAQTEKAAGQIKLDAFAEVAWPSDFPKESGPERAKVILQCFRRAVEQSQIKSRNIFLALSGTDSIVRGFELPLLPKKDQKNAIRFETQKYVPFEIRELFLDFETVPDSARNRMRVIVSAAKRVWVEELVSVLHGEGFRVTATELASHSIARVFLNLDSKSSTIFTAVLHANNDMTADLIIYKGSVIYAHRHIALTHLSNSQTVDTAHLVSDVRLCLDSFSKIFKTEKIQKLWLCSGQALESSGGLAELLQQALGVPVQAQSWPPIQGKAPVKPSAGLAVAYGASCRQIIDPKAKKINLFSSIAPRESVGASPSAEDEKKDLQQFAIKGVLLAVAMLALIAGVFYYLRSEKQGELSRIRSSYPVSIPGADRMDAAALEAQNTAAAEKVAFISRLVDNRTYFASKLGRLLRVVPESIFLRRLSYEDSIDRTGFGSLSLVLEGYVPFKDTAGDLTVINKFVVALNADKSLMQGLGEIKILSASKSQLGVGGREATQFKIESSKVRRGGT